jgi:hypothetical protein
LTGLLSFRNDSNLQDSIISAKKGSHFRENYLLAGKANGIALPRRVPGAPISGSREVHEMFDVPGRLVNFNHNAIQVYPA